MDKLILVTILCFVGFQINDTFGTLVIPKRERHCFEDKACVYDAECGENAHCNMDNAHWECHYYPPCMG